MPGFKIGPAVRTRLGRFEVPAADAYRSVFINLEDCAELISSLWPAQRILEVGCGDGSFAERLLDRYRTAEYVGIDISDEPGRLFRGDQDRATFHSIDSRAFRAQNAEPFDLVVVVDVVHHIPLASRRPILEDVRALTRPGGHYVIKEWEPTKTFTHLACWAADRFITGDDISHVHSSSLQADLKAWLGDDLVIEGRVPPRRNNYLLGYARET